LVLCIEHLSTPVWRDEVKAPGKKMLVEHAEFGIGRVVKIHDGGFYVVFSKGTAPIRITPDHLCFSLTAFDLLNSGGPLPVLNPRPYWRPTAKKRTSTVIPRGKSITTVRNIIQPPGDVVQDPVRSRMLLRPRIDLSKVSAEAAGRRRLEQLHQAALTLAEGTWRLECENRVESAQGNPDRQYYDAGMRIVHFIHGYHNANEMFAASVWLLTQEGDMPKLLSLRLRLACAGYTQTKAAKYLGLTEYQVRQVDGELVKAPLELRTPRNSLNFIPLNRKRTPKAGWASDILSRYLRMGTSAVQ
jgi:hypothetical protein